MDPVTQKCLDLMEALGEEAANRHIIDIVKLSTSGTDQMQTLIGWGKASARAIEIRKEVRDHPGGKPYYDVERRHEGWVILMSCGPRANDKVYTNPLDALKEAFRMRCTTFPQVGDPATFGYGSDRYPATVVEVSTDLKKVGIVPDKVINDGQFEPGDPNHVRYYSLRDNRKWVAVGESKQSGGRLSLGHKDYHQDPHF